MMSFTWTIFGTILLIIGFNHNESDKMSERK